MAISEPPASITVPVRYPTATIFLDESGSKATASRSFVVAAVKFRKPGAFARALRDLRDKHGFEGEFKFSEITRGSLPCYYAVIDALEQSDAHLAACVVEGRTCNPFKGQAAWRAHAEVAARLLVGCINRRELVGVLLDAISTPRGCSFEDTVRDLVNRRLRSTSIVSANCLDSRTSDTLQVADLVAGAIFFERRRSAGEHGLTSGNKAKVAARLGAAFDCVGMADVRNDRVNIATFKTRARSRPALSIVSKPSQAG